MNKLLFILSLLGLIFFLPKSEPEQFKHSPCSPPGKGAILISFDGYKPKTPIWGFKVFNSSGLNSVERRLILKEVKRAFQDWDVVVTTDESLFYKFPVNKRVRCVVINDSIVTYSRFYETFFLGENIYNSLFKDSITKKKDLNGNYFRKSYAGGIAVLNSLCKGDTTTTLVSSFSLSFHERYIARAICHEIGHALGLLHKSDWIGIIRMQEYSEGDSLRVPIMGSSVADGKTAVWTKKNINQNWEFQNDQDIISQTWTRTKYTH